MAYLLEHKLDSEMINRTVTLFSSTCNALAWIVAVISHDFLTHV